jgi:hypothetical protein
MKTATIAMLSLVCVLLVASAASAGLVNNDSGRLGNTDLNVNWYSMPLETASADASPTPLAVDVSTSGAIGIAAAGVLALLAIAWVSWLFFADRIVPVVRWSHDAGRQAPSNKTDAKLESVVKFDSCSRKAA